MSTPFTNTRSIARSARWLRDCTTLLVVGTGLLLAWPLVLALAYRRVPGGWANWSELVAPLIYLWGLIYLRSAFARIAAGALFGPAVHRALAALGMAMIVGAALEVAVIPNLLFWTLGPGHGGALLRFDVSALSVGAIGAGLVLIARLFAAAAAMSEELDGIL